MATTFDVEVSREFDAPIERVWAAWTTPADLREWWGPEGFTCPRAEAVLSRDIVYERVATQDFFVGSWG